VNSLFKLLFQFETFVVKNDGGDIPPRSSQGGFVPRPPTTLNETLAGFHILPKSGI
jgi:hypothetical protein